MGGPKLGCLWRGSLGVPGGERIGGVATSCFVSRSGDGELVFPGLVSKSGRTPDPSACPPVCRSATYAASEIEAPPLPSRRFSRHKSLKDERRPRRRPVCGVSSLPFPFEPKQEVRFKLDVFMPRNAMSPLSRSSPSPCADPEFEKTSARFPVRAPAAMRKRQSVSWPDTINKKGSVSYGQTGTRNVW